MPRTSLLFLGVLLSMGCSGATHAPTSQATEKPAPVEAPEPIAQVDAKPGITPLRSGELSPIVHREPIEAKLSARCVASDSELFEIELPASIVDTFGGMSPKAASEAFWDRSSRSGLSAAVAFLPSAAGEGAGEPGFALFGDNDDGPSTGATPPLLKNSLWLRRSSTDAGKPLLAELFVAARDASPGHHFVVTVAADATLTAQCKDGKRYGRALRRYLSLRESAPFNAFAIERLATVFGKQTPPRETSTEPSRETELLDLMQLFSGADSIEAALQRQAQLHSGLDRGRSTVALASIAAPRLSRHPWVEMLAALPERAAPEPMASATPADFYFVRSRDIGGLFQLLDESEAWLGPLFALLDESAGDRRLIERYETELGLKRSAANRAFGPSLIDEVALVGSDPFLTLGSDLTLLFRVKSDAAFASQLIANLSEHERDHGMANLRESIHQGIKIELRQSADRKIHQYTARVAGLITVSNSLAATERVISTALGKAPALGAELDFQYMLARDAKTESTVLVYMGDRFIERAVSPAARISSARRLIAQSELRRPGYAALLHGWLSGHAPATLADLTRTKLLQASDLRHFDASPIRFELGQAATSAWGASDSMVPLLDLPNLTKVTPRERDAYERFRSEYESLWSEAVDPIALRLRVEEAPQGTALSAKLRILPLVRQREYQDIQELVGDVRLAPGKIQSGLRALFGIAADSGLRRELTRTSQGFIGQRFGLDWLGSWGMLGLGDHDAVANVFAETSDAPKLSTPNQQRGDEIEALTKLPLYVGFEVQSGAGAALALTVIRNRLADSSLEWQADREYRSFKIHEVRSNDFESARLFYVLTERALYFSLSETMIRQLIDAELGGELPSTDAKALKQGQFAIDFSARPAGGLATTLIWALEQEARNRSAAAARNAEILFQAAPEARHDESVFRKLALHYLGAIPTTPEGKLFRFTKSGATDGLRGNAFAPNWPALPIPKSPITQVLGELGSLRAQMAFDREPALTADAGTSLAISVELTRRHAKP